MAASVNPPPPPPAYARPSQPNNDAAELPAYSVGSLFSNYNENIKEPPEVHPKQSRSSADHQIPAVEVNVKVRDVEAGNVQDVNDKRRGAAEQHKPQVCLLFALLIMVIFFIVLMAHHSVEE